ncbi:T9SS type B sorting domain-containing protein [Christiangramia flava]|uniref:Uncharacterized protein n=1 Tax=Christiangramia flava JLT2011 TaxID=1229726 RepID=A0A1L7I9Q3_9FLAO|nr:T9SS type B sorting domain-containing protein [Christiangramia flava]APU69944.1 hypothetical protein GRFL_3220 [Christiangramia flava JLT2011]OSS39429.1 hypothetical protein C723_1331 [Christiangramia flava JLT2011]
MRRILIFGIFIFIGLKGFSQLGFCSGSKGDPIFQEDFGSGSGFGDPLQSGITEYRYVSDTDPNDGQYAISSQVGQYNTSWHSYFPSTTYSGGRALIVNADFTPGRFYRKQIDGLCENTTYEFSAFIMNVYDRDSGICENGGIPNNVRFEIWDETDAVLLKSGDTGDILSSSNPQWTQYALTFSSEPGQNSVILKMFNNGEGGCGNDLAIDDIVFRSCGDLTTVESPDTTASPVNLCAEETPYSVELNAASDNSVYEQVFYQWQQSSDGENWQDIPGANSIQYQTTALTETRYFRVKAAEDPANLGSNVCSSASEAFQVQIFPKPEPPESLGDRSACENDPIPYLEVKVGTHETANWYDDNGNLLAAGVLRYQPENAGIFYAEAVVSSRNCQPSERTAIQLEITDLPEVSDEITYICPGTLKLLEAGVSGYQYLWNTGATTETINIATPGTYSVRVSSSSECYITRTIVVNTVPTPGIIDVVTDGWDVEIIPITEADFLYSIDGINFQAESRFENVPGGIYTAYMKDTESCQVETLTFAHIVFPEYITPNNDGYHDVFEIRGIEFFPSSNISIFDRYGKLLKSGRGQGFQWNGTFINKPMPAADYWYFIEIEGYGTKKGHFSLVRD